MAPLLIFSFIIFSAFLFISFSPAFFTVAKSACGNQVRSLLYSAVLSVSESEDFSSLADIKEVNGKITSISLNTKSTNKIRAALAEKINSNLSDEKHSTFHIPVGNLTKIPLLSGRGLKIPVRIIPLGSIDADICSELTDAGINQTKHSVYIKASAKVSLMTPFSSAVTETETSIPLTETVIVGDIPSLYAGGLK